MSQPPPGITIDHSHMLMHNYTLESCLPLPLQPPVASQLINIGSVFPICDGVRTLLAGLQANLSAAE